MDDNEASRGRRIAVTINYRLCNILLSDGIRSDNYPQIYVRKSNPSYRQSDGTTVVSDSEYVQYDLLTYFNAFSNEKWRRYTVVDNVHLHLNVRGSLDIDLLTCDQTPTRPQTTVVSTHHVEHDELRVVEFEFPDVSTTLLGVRMRAHGRVEVKEAYYFTKVDEELIRPVELAIAMTTFKNERYVIPNIELIKNEILACDEPVANHLTMHVIDNGQSLDVEELSSDRVRIHPNPNVGGSGGFTRGMIEAMEQEDRATHVLLMDDDVQVSPESIKRTFNVLSLVNEEYVDAFLSGAMMSFERQDEFYEDLGFVDPDATPGPVKSKHIPEDMPVDPFIISDLDDVVKIESVETRRNNRYAGWWYCCIPVSSIERNGLPLPLFIRCDDMEYGIRCADRFITMNGICVWHVMFGSKYRLAIERYQTMRNSLIAQATTGAFEGVNFMQRWHALVYQDFKNFNYVGVELSLAAVEDFLKGPDFIKNVNAARLNARMSKMNDVLVPIEEMDQSLLGNVELNSLDLFESSERGIYAKAFDLLTFNGQVGPKWMSKGGLGVIPYADWAYSPNAIRGKDAILAVVSQTSMGVLRKKDRSRFASLRKRHKAVVKEYEAKHEEVEAQWAAARSELTSLEFWKWYLKSQGEGSNDRVSSLDAHDSSR